MQPLTPGARLGSYEILSALGAGGMGEVYRARDTRLGRDVALKILPAIFAMDLDRAARFEREARTLAALNHPNIGGLHGVQESDGVTALVMELVEGEELAARIARGALPVPEALAIARQIADALQAAHDQGIVHRDLKPANVKVRPDGTVKVLDFGLALALDPVAGSDANPMNSPTITIRATELGVILGTAAYMAPEQARGRAVDRRADIWAFGCVLYEMLTGHRAFQGDDLSDVLASVLAREPDMTALPSGVPAPVHRLLRRCFVKDPRERLRDMGDARLEIDDALDNRETVAAARAGARPYERAVWIAAVALLGVTAALAWTRARTPASGATEARLEIGTPSSLSPTSVAISPDGRTVAFVATADGQSRLWVRPLASSDARPLHGTEGAVSPFWSPNSRSIGFFAASRLKRVDLDGGAVLDLAHVQRGTGGTWNRDDVILFSSLGDPIARIQAGGGSAQELRDLVQQGSNFSPHFLPDGRRFLYHVRGTSDVRGIYVGQLDGASPRHRLLEAEPGVVYASGHLLFVRQRTVFAQPFDPGSVRLSGSPVPLSDPSSDCSCGRLSASDAGVIVFRAAATATPPHVGWFNRSGAEAGAVAAFRIAAPSLSRDDRRIAGYGSNPADGNIDVWIFDISRGASERLTINVADDVAPLWSPAGDRILFSSNRAGTHDLYQKRASVDAPEDLVLATPQEKLGSDWSRDGRFILFDSRDFGRASDIWALSLEAGGKPFPVAQTGFDETRAQFSPDGQWIAYQSDEPGRHEIYVQRFPAVGDKRRVSTGGGTQVRWSHNGDELFYMAPEGRLMAVRVWLTASGEAPELGAPVALFPTPLGIAAQLGDYRHQYAVSSDARRFLLATPGQPANVPITVILNWRR